MKRKVTFLRRCVALVLALALFVSGTNLHAVMPVFAVEENTDTTVTGGTLMALSYSQLSDAEKALLASGLLPGEAYSFTAPGSGDGLIDVDTDAKTITAKTYRNGDYTWNAVRAALYDDAESLVETVAMTNGACSYTYDKKAFSVQVTYEMTMQLSTDIQRGLLDNISALKTGREYADAIYETDADLSVVALAMDSLIMLANGLSVSFAGGNVTVRMGGEASSAVRALNKQINANGGKMDLQEKNAAYGTAESRMEYLLTSGSDYRSTAVQTYGYLKLIQADPILNNNLVDSYIKSYKPEMDKAWSTLKGRIGVLVEALERVTGEWDVLNTQTVRDGLTADDYRQLDTLMEPISELDKLVSADDLQLTQTLVADRTVISGAASIVNVQILVQLQTYDADNNQITVPYESVQKLAEGVSLEQIQTLADVLELDAKAGYAAQGYDLTCFDRVVDTDIGAALGGDPEAHYTVTYVPKSYTVTTADGETGTYPYGYHLRLETYADSTAVYDYYINGVYHAQGTLYRVSGDAVITRQEGRPYTNTTLMRILADCFGTEKEAAILRSGALVGDMAVSVRYPDASAQTLVRLEDGVLSAENYPSNYQGLEWKPYSYTILDETKYFNGANSVEVPIGGFDTIRVIYRLTLTNVSAAQAQAYMDDVRGMANAAAGQSAAMEKLNAQYGSMGQLTKGMLTVLKSVIGDTELHEDPDKNAELQEYFIGIVGQIVTNCIDANNSLKIYNILTDYRGAGNGLAYYFRNSRSVIDEVQLLSGYLSAMMADEEKIEALRVLVAAVGKPDYADKLIDLKQIVAEVSADLVEPGAAMDISSKNLDVLAEALTMAGALGTDTITQSPYLDSAPFLVEAPDKASVKVTITAGDRVVDTVIHTYELDHTLTQTDMDAVRAEVNAIIEASLQTAYYTASVDVELDSLVGTAIRKTISVSYHYEPHTYTVRIDGEEDQTVSIEDLTIMLPKAPVGYRYDYVVDGVVCGFGTYRFTTAQLDRLFADGSYTITRTMVNVAAENLNAFLSALNEAGGGVLKFSLNEARNTITVDVAAANNGALYSKVTEVAMAMVNSSYDYIGMNEQGMMYTTEEGDLQISLQTLVNAILCDNSFGSRTLIDLKDGGRLAQTTLQLGDSADALEQDLIFEINVTSTSDEIISTGSALQQIEENLTFQAEDGVLHVDMSLTDEYYEGLLTMLLITGVVEKDGVNELRSGDALKFLFTYTEQLSADETVTTTTFENTAGLLGMEFDLAKHQIYYQYMTDLVNSSTFTFERDACRAEMTMDIKTPLDAAVAGSEMGSMLGMIKEYESGLIIDLSFVLETWDGYEALILDAETGEVVYTENLAESLDSVTGSSTILLQSDVTGDLVIPGTATLDLNGYTVSGSVTASGTLCIIDSARGTGNCGSVTGALSGEIMVLSGGFNADVTRYLLPGYIQQDGIVQNAGFSVAVDRNGNLTYTIHGDTQTAVGGIVEDILYDLVLYSITGSEVVIDGATMYSAGLYDLLSIIRGGDANDALTETMLESLNMTGINTLINAVYADLLDFAAVAQSAASGESVGSYEMAATPWALEIEHVPQGDYLAFHLVTGLDTDVTTVDIAVDGDRTGEMADELREIITDSSITAEVEQPVYHAERNVVSVAVGSKIMIEMDLSESSDYAVMLSVLMAHSNASLRQGVVQAVNSGDMKALKAVLDKATVQQLRSALTDLDADFAATAAGLGITADISGAAALERVYHHRLLTLAEQIAQLNLQNGDKTLASLESAEQPGCYVFTEMNILRSETVPMGSCSVEHSAAVTEVTLRLNIFGGKAIEVLDASDKVIKSTDSLSEAIAALVDGGTLRFRKDVELDRSWTIGKAIKLDGGEHVSMNGYWFLLSVGGSIRADAKLRVASAANGYLVAGSTEGSAFTYRLSAIQAPTGDQSIAEVWTASHNGVNYLLVDMEPKQGKQLSQLQASLTFGDLNGLNGSVNFTISGNDGTARVKTGNELTITVTDGGSTIAVVTYTLIVAGDVNRDGLVNSGDAVAMTNIYNGNKAAYNHAQLLAADANKNGTADTPRIDAGDAVRIMNKYLDWNAYLALVSK